MKKAVRIGENRRSMKAEKAAVRRSNELVRDASASPGSDRVLTISKSFNVNKSTDASIAGDRIGKMREIKAEISTLMSRLDQESQAIYENYSKKSSQPVL